MNGQSNYCGQKGLHRILGSVEQHKMYLVVGDCTDTWCSSLMFFSGHKILSHPAAQCEKNNELKENIIQGHKS